MGNYQVFCGVCNGVCVCVFVAILLFFRPGVDEMEVSDGGMFEGGIGV